MPATNVRRHREAAGLSIRQLARATGLDANTIMAAEHDGNPRLSTLQAISRVLKVPVHTLLGGDPEPDLLPSGEGYVPNV